MNLYHGEKHVSSFQAFAISIASRVGTGNLAGVATAIAIGGPGAVFWMWVIALLGASSAFIESTLAQQINAKFSQMKTHLATGGSAGNAILGLACLGAGTGFIGKVGNEIGRAHV